MVRRGYSRQKRKRQMLLWKLFLEMLQEYLTKIKSVSHVNILIGFTPGGTGLNVLTYESTQVSHLTSAILSVMSVHPPVTRNSAGGGDGGSLTGGLIRHGESSYLAALERFVPKARPHMESFCQARGVLGDGGNQSCFSFLSLTKACCNCFC